MTSVTSILPGTLVQSLVTAVVPDGLNLQVLGYFGGTVDQYHLVPGNPEENYKVGQKLKARVLYNVAASSPPRFALSLAEHLIALTPKSAAGSGLPDAYPIGTTLDAVKVVRVESERGLVVEVSDGAEGYVHVRTNQALPLARRLFLYMIDIAGVRRPCSVAIGVLWTLEDWECAQSPRYWILPVGRLSPTILPTNCPPAEVPASRRDAGWRDDQGDCEEVDGLGLVRIHFGYCGRRHLAKSLRRYPAQAPAEAVQAGRKCQVSSTSQADITIQPLILNRCWLSIRSVGASS